MTGGRWKKDMFRGNVHGCYFYLGVYSVYRNKDEESGSSSSQLTERPPVQLNARHLLHFWERLNPWLGGMAGPQFDDHVSNTKQLVFHFHDLPM